MEYLPILIIAALWAKCGLVLIAAVIGAYALHRVVREFRTSNADAVAATKANVDRLDDLGAHAGMQHAGVKQGDPRGNYSEPYCAST